MIGRVMRWDRLDWVGFREVDCGAFFLSVAALFPAPFDAGRGIGFFGSSLFRQLHEDFLPGLKKRAARGAGIRAAASDGRSFGYFDSSEAAAVWVRPMVCLVDKGLK